MEKPFYCSVFVVGLCVSEHYQTVCSLLRLASSEAAGGGEEGVQLGSI